MPTSNNTNHTKTPLVEIGALWARIAKSSNEKYLNGTIKLKTDAKAGDEISVIIFSNKSKKAENQPDLRVFLSDKFNSKPAPKIPSIPQVKNDVAAVLTDDEQGLF
jgi:hypothetical protein